MRLVLLLIGVLFFTLAAIEDHVHQNAQNESGGDGADFDNGILNVAELQGQSADAAHQDGGHNEQVAVVTQVNRLQHLEAGYSDEAVQSDADTAGDAGRNGVDESGEGAEEGQNDAVDGGDHDGGNGSVAGDGHAADRLTIGGVGAAAEDGADDGTGAVAHQSAVQTGIGDQIAVDDGTQVLMVGNMFRQGYEGNRSEQHEDADHITDAGDAVGNLTGVIAHTEEAQEGEVGHLENLHIVKGRQVDDLESGAIGSIADQGKDQTDDVSGQDTYDEGDHLQALASLYGSPHSHTESKDTQRDVNQAVVLHTAVGIHQVGYGAAAQ